MESPGIHTQLNIPYMQNLRLIFTLLFCVAITQVYGQFEKSNFGGYYFSIQVDSSEFHIVGGKPNKSEKIKYVAEDRSQGYSGYYTGESQLWSNAYVFNDSTDKLIKLFDFPLVAVFPSVNTMQHLKYDYNYQRTVLSGTSKENLIFAVKIDEYNKDGVIDSDDPVYIFICRKDGTECKQFSPPGMNVTNWRLIKDGMGILLTIQSDKNSDKKFTEDEELYQIDLHSTISKIQ